ncbi:hypothetical protein HKD37_02G004764 [Glycine soja]
MIRFTRFFCRSWTSGCTYCCHWVTRTPRSCACCWSRCDDQAILRTSLKDLPHVFLHGSRRPRAADSTNQGPTGGVNHRKSDSTTNVILQPDGLALPLEPEVGPSAARVNTKESCADLSGNDPNMGDSDKCGLYIKENRPRLVTQGRVYEGSTIIHNIPLLHDQVKVSVEEVRDADAPIPVPTEEVKLVGQALNTFLTWPTHLGVVGPAKPADRPDYEVDDPLYLMTLTIPQLFLKPLQVMWDAIVFGVFNEDFPLYIKHEDLHMTQTSMRAGNVDVYGFLEPQSIQRYGQSQFELESYMKNWMQNSKWDVYLGAYLNGALKGLDDIPQPKSKAGARWIVVKIIGIKEIEGASHPVGKVLSES